MNGIEGLGHPIADLLDLAGLGEIVQRSNVIRFGGEELLAPIWGREPGRGDNPHRMTLPPFRKPL